jgi:hypothetical protein
MPGQQQDYIVRHLETISRLIARLRRKGGVLSPEDHAELHEALFLAAQLQERNFGRPAREFLALPADEQFAALRQGESPSIGHDRCLTYATLLRTTAELYALRGGSDLALGARQLALYIALRVALDEPADAGAARSLVEDLRHLLAGAELHPPTQELLTRLGERAE